MKSLNENKTPVVKIQRRTPGVMAVTWVINNICTNACLYCPPNLHKGKNHHYDWENAKRFWQILLEKYEQPQGSWLILLQTGERMHAAAEEIELVKECK